MEKNADLNYFSPFPTIFNIRTIEKLVGTHGQIVLENQRCFQTSTGRRAGTKERKFNNV